MKSGKLISVASLALALGVFGLVFASGASAADENDVKMDGAEFQEVLDKLFGTPEDPGLLEGDKKFSLHAKDVTMTAEQADLFFNPSETNLSDFADLVAAAEALKANLKIEGELLDMDSFKLNLSGKQIKVEGLVLTQAEFDALIAELKEIDSLKQAKITATVDGRTMIAKLENQPGRVKIEDKGLAPEERRGANRSSNSGKPERPERVERVSRGERPERPEKIERIERGGPGRQ